MVHVFDIASEEDFRRGFQDGFIDVKSHPVYDLEILCYTKPAQYTDGAFDNPAVRACRGLIIDGEGTVVARPWKKFFNYGQIDDVSAFLDSPAVVSDKMDGALGILVPVQKNRYEIATKGSFISEQAKVGTGFLPHYLNQGFQPHPEITYLFEIIAPETKVVLNYGDFKGLVLLGGVEIETGHYIPIDSPIFNDWTGAKTEVMPARTLRKALELPPRPDTKGICVHILAADNYVKIKEENYILAHKALSGMTDKKLAELLQSGQSIQDIVSVLPDELYAEFSGRCENILSLFEEVKNNIIEEYKKLPKFSSKKEFSFFCEGQRKCIFLL